MLGPYGLLHIPALEGPGLNVSQLIVFVLRHQLAAVQKSRADVLYLGFLSADGHFIENFLLDPKSEDMEAPVQTGLRCYVLLAF